MEEEEKGYSHRKEYVSLEKQLTTAKRNFDSLSEEYDIAMLDPKEAHTKFVARVNDHKQVHSLSLSSLSRPLSFPCLLLLPHRELSIWSPPYLLSRRSSRI
jgi:hypothetical protein